MIQYIYKPQILIIELQIFLMSTNKKQIKELAKILPIASSTIWTSLQSLIPEKQKVSQDQPQRNLMMDLSSNKPQFELVNKMFDSLSLFDKIEHKIMDDTIEYKIENLNLNAITFKRKDSLFKRFRQQQEKKFSKRKREIEKNYFLKTQDWKLMKSQFHLKNQKTGKTDSFPINSQDMEKLKPETDLNDTIVGNYIKLLQLVFLDPEIDKKTYIFSSFFLEKLIGEYVKEQTIMDKDPKLVSELVKQKVKENYKNVKRWTKKIDIFEKQILVFPINAFRHWYCLFILLPGSIINPTESQKCQIIYCDSMFQHRQFVIDAIIKYLQYELQEKKGLKLDLEQNFISYYQLMLPRQTNTHDCGLYMISYIEELLMKKQELEKLNIIDNRKKLHLFPRSLILTMRERLKKLFTKLINSKDDKQKTQILSQYTREKAKIIKEVDPSDYDEINQKEYKKYEKMNLNYITSSKLPEERKFACEIKFYLDPEINFFETDKK